MKVPQCGLFMLPFTSYVDTAVEEGTVLLRSLSIGQKEDLCSYKEIVNQVL